MIVMLSDLTHVQVAMKVMVDNFALLGIEYCVLDGLSDILSPDTVMKLDETLTKEIAAETEDSQTERARTLKKLESLEAGLQTLNRFGRHKTIGRWSPFMKARPRRFANQCSLTAHPKSGYTVEDRFDRGESEDEISLDSADINEDSYQEHEYRPAQEVKSPEIGDAVPLGPARTLSPFDGNGASGPDDSWLSSRLTNSNKKKGKRMPWPEE